MKRIVILFLLIFVICGLSHAATVEKIKAYIATLEKKLETAEAKGNKARVEKINQLISDARAELDKRQEEEAAPVWVEEEVKLIKPEEPLAAAAPAQPKEEPQPAVQGRAYINWQKDLKEGSTTPNKFDISRVYLDYKSNLDQNVSVRVTTDIARTLEAINVYLKYAYFDINNITLPHVDTIRIGQSPTHWIGLIDDFWSLRYLAETMTDNYGFFNSADLGLAALGTVEKIHILGDVKYHAILMNGLNRGKDIGLTVKAEPLFWGEKDKVTAALGFLAEDVALSKLDLTGLAKKATALLAYQFSKPRDGYIYIEYANQMESKEGGISVAGKYEIADNTSVFGRVDNFNKSGDDYLLNIAGLEYGLGKNVKLALDYQYETKNKADNSKIIALHTQVVW